MTVYEDDDEAIAIWQDLGIGCPARAPRKTDNYWWTHAAGPQAVLGDLRRSRVAFRPEAARRRRGPLHGDLEPRLHAAPGRRACGGARRPAAEEHRHRLEHRTRGWWCRTSSFFETDLLFAAARRRRSRASTTGPTNGTTSRSGSSASTRATAFLVADGVQPRTRMRVHLRRMLRRVVSNTRQLGVQGEVLRPLVGVVVEGFGGRTPARREPGVHRAGARFGGGTLQRHPPPGHDAVRRGEGARRRRRIVGADAFKLSTRSGSRSS